MVLCPRTDLGCYLARGLRGTCRAGIKPISRPQVCEHRWSARDCGWWVGSCRDGDQMKRMGTPKVLDPQPQGLQDLKPKPKFRVGLRACNQNMRCIIGKAMSQTGWQIWCQSPQAGCSFPSKLPNPENPTALQALKPKMPSNARNPGLSRFNSAVRISESIPGQYTKRGGCDARTTKGRVL